MKYVQKDIISVTVDAIVNASNGKGWMGGFLGRYFLKKGIAEAINFATKGKVEKEAKAIAQRVKPVPGDVFITSAHNLDAILIFHAVTMLKPGQRSDIETISTCLTNILEQARTYNITSIAIPFLGTGTGRVPLIQVWKLYEKVLGTVDDMEVIVVDPKGHFMKRSNRGDGIPGGF